MAASLKVQSLLLSSSRTSSSSILCRCHRRFQATLQAPISPRNNPRLPNMISIEKLLHTQINGKTKKIIDKKEIVINGTSSQDGILISKLYAIAEAVADRAEMHSIIGQQRNDWNQLFLNSINSITLTASLMAAVSSVDQQSAALNISSALLFASATGMMLLVNKIQPSQLAEEQRKATQLFKQLERSIHTTIALGSFTELDVEEFMDKVLAIDRAYPLPLLPLLKKFPKKVEPAVWWPKLKKKSAQTKKIINSTHNNGWSKELEQEMKGALRVIKAKDEVQYIECGQLASNINKTLAISGPLFAGLAALSSSQLGNGSSWPALFAVVGGALATIVNTLEHGGQMGMVFELFRNSAGYYRNLEEEIEKNLGEREVEKREDGELFRMKMALHLGRDPCELKSLASYASDSCPDDDIKEYAGKLF